jgi:hypothetical protein
LDNTKSDDTKWDNTKSDDTESNDTKSDDTKSVGFLHKILVLCKRTLPTKTGLGYLLVVDLRRHLDEGVGALGHVRREVAGAVELAVGQPPDAVEQVAGLAVAEQGGAGPECARGAGTDVTILKNIFAEKFGEKIGVFDSKQS